MKKFIEKLCEGVVKEWGMIVALVLLAMPPMLFAPVFFGGLHSGFVNGFDMELWRQLKYPVVDMGLLMLLVLVVVEIVHWIGKKWVKWVVYGVAVALATVRIWLWWVFRMRITPLTMSLLLGTNSQESCEFVNLYLVGWYGVGLVGMLIGLVGICLFFEWMSGRYVFSGVWKKCYVVLSALCFVWGVVEIRWIVKMVDCDVTDDVNTWQLELGYDGFCYGMSNIEAVFFSIVCNPHNLNDIKVCERTAYEVASRKNEVSCESDSLLVVFVLGESYIKSHNGLYGYRLNTTPLLNEEKMKDNLYVFDDVVSPYTLTANAMKTIFYTNDYSEPWYKSVFFPQLFRIAGFEVDMWDNQRPFGTNECFCFDYFYTIYNEELRKYSYSNVSEQKFKYDGALIDDYIQQSFDLDCKRMVIFHLWGQHFDFKERFPSYATDIHFRGSDVKSEYVAMYDNACVYNDKVVSEIIDMVRDKKSVVVYFSDHGEEVYDYRDCCGRRNAEPGMEKEFLKYQAEVPFMIWCSDKYKEAYPEIIEDIKASVDKPFITDNVCQVMFHLAGLKSPWYNEERDLLSDKYKCGKRIVNGMYDYDEIMGRK